MGSVCSLIAYTRSWVSDQVDPDIGAGQTAIWAEALRRAMACRDDIGEDRFADVGFADLNADPVGAVASSFEHLGLPFTPASRRAVEGWAAKHRRGEGGIHEFDLDEFNLTSAGVRRDFAFYLERFGDLATGRPLA